MKVTFAHSIASLIHTKVTMVPVKDTTVHTITAFIHIKDTIVHTIDALIHTKVTMVDTKAAFVHTKAIIRYINQNLCPGYSNRQMNILQRPVKFRLCRNISRGKP